MNRRRFIASIAGGGISFSALHQQSPRSRLHPNDATPAPDDDGSLLGPLPDPVELGSGLTLVDYHFGTAAGYPRMLAEVVNETGSVIDTPRILMAFRDRNNNVLMEENLWGFTDLILPDERGQLFTEFYGDDPLEIGEDHIDFSLTQEVSPSTSVGRFYTLDYEIELESEDMEEESYIGRGSIVNTGGSTIAEATILGVFRNAEDRYIGHTFGFVQSELPPGQFANFTIDVNVRSAVPHDPFDVMREGEDYTIDISATARL